MKLFTAICLCILVVLSFGKDTASTRDTTVIANTVKVEIQSSPKISDDIAAQNRIEESVLAARRFTSDSTQTERMIAAAESTANWTLMAMIFAAIAVFVSLLVWVGSSKASIGITDYHWIVQNISGFWIHIGLKNNGHTEARKMHFTYNFLKVGRNHFKEVYKEQPLEDYLPECAPGETIMLKAGVQMDASDIESKRDGSDLRDIVFWGVVHYQDVFRRWHKKPFRFYVSWPDVKGSKLTLNRWHTDYENEKENAFFRGLK